jgi:hypothetical protein
MWVVFENPHGPHVSTLIDASRIDASRGFCVTFQEKYHSLAISALQNLISNYMGGGT